MAVSRCARCGQLPKADIDFSGENIKGKVFCRCVTATFNEGDGESFDSAVANWRIKTARVGVMPKEAQPCSCRCWNTLYGRPCVLTGGRKGMFHGWETLHNPESIRGVVEVKDSELVYAKPEDIQFVDGGRLFGAISWTD